MLLERKLIYTAITRAKKLVVLVGSKKALAMAVRNGPDFETTATPKDGISKGGVRNIKEDKPGSNYDTRAYRAGPYTGLTTRLSQLG